MDRTAPDFDAAHLITELDQATDAELDAWPFGVIGFDGDGKVVRYNAAEAALSGLDPERVIGLHFFTEVAPCTDNALIAGRFHGAEQLDEQLAYTFTMRMSPTAVQLRLLARPESPLRYLLVRRST
jgi:photoactive yellow protein